MEPRNIYCIGLSNHPNGAAGRNIFFAVVRFPLRSGMKQKNLKFNPHCN
jgi:hypothetical protein